MHHRLIMTIFGTLIFFLVLFEVASVLLPKKLEDGKIDYIPEFDTAEKHSFAGVDKTWYNFFCGCLT